MAAIGACRSVAVQAGRFPGCGAGALDVSGAVDGGKRRRGRRRLEDGPALDRERLVAALLKLAHEEGASALNMRRVAVELEVSPRLLYLHVRDKEEMLELLGDAIIARNMPDLTERDWKARLRTLAASARKTFSHYPGLPAAILARSLNRADRPYTQTMRGAVFTALDDAGLAPDEAAEAYINFATLVLGSLVMVENIAQSSDALFVDRDHIERSLDKGIELLLFGIDRAAANRRGAYPASGAGNQTER